MKKIFYRIYLVIKNLMFCGLFLTLIIGFLAYISPAFRNYEDGATESVLSTFYEEDKDSADVVFVGSSALYRFIAPTQLYDKYGIVSLNYASPAMDVNAMPGLIDEIIDYQHPKVIVLEMRNYVNNCKNQIENIEYTENEKLERESYFRKLINNMPLSFNRMKVIHDTVTNTFEQDEYEWQFEYSTTHHNWKNLSFSDLMEFVEAKSEFELVTHPDPDSLYKGEYYKGTIATRSIFSNPSVDFTNYEERKEITGEWRDTLMRIVKKAKTCGTEVLFFTSPYPIDAERAAYENSMGDILKSEGLNFLNGNKLIKKMNINFSTDFYDDKHTNINGMVKVTDYVGQYLIDTYGLKESDLSDEQRESWDYATEKWIAEVREPGLEKVRKYALKLQESES